MPIRTVRAVPYGTMKEFLDGKLNIATDEASDHEKTYIVSITNPDVPPLIRMPRENQLVFQFHDVEIKTDQYTGLSLPMHDDLIYFDETMASEVCALVGRAMSDPADVYFLTNCQAGISRSGAVSTFVRQVAGIDFESWRQKNRSVNPNTHVLGLLNWAWASNEL